MRGAGFDQALPVKDVELADALHNVGRQRPVMMPMGRYTEFVGQDAAGPSLAWPPALPMWKGAMPAVDDWIGRAQAVSTIDVNFDDVQILLPGPYAVCGEPRWGPMLQAPAGSQRPGHLGN